MSTNDYQIITAAEAAADTAGVEVRSGARPYAPVSFVKLSKDGDFITFTYTGGGTFTIPTSHKPAFRRAIPGDPSATAAYRVTYRVQRVQPGPAVITNRRLSSNGDGTFTTAIQITEGYSTLADAPKIVAIAHPGYVGPADVEIVSIEALHPAGCRCLSHELAETLS